MEKFLVTGAMGFVGSHWCEYLLKKGKTVYGLDLHSHAEHLLDYDNFIFVQDTAKNYELLRTLTNQVDCVCHLAGIATPTQYTAFPRKVIDITAMVSLQLIELCRATGKLFFFTSTSEIYGKNAKIPFKENDDRVLGSTGTHRWCYSTSKALIEHYLNACAFTKELNNVVVRLFNVYGPRLKGRVVSNFVQAALDDEDIVIHSDGKQTRAFTYIDDVVEIFYRLVSDPKCYNNTFNIGQDKETTIIDLAKLIVEQGHSKSKIKFIKHENYYGKSYEDINRRVPDTSKLKEYIGVVPETTLESGIKSTLEYYQGTRKKEGKKRPSQRPFSEVQVH